MKFLGVIQVYLSQWFYIALLVVVGSVMLIVTSCDSPEDVQPDQGNNFIKLFGGNGSEEGRDLAAFPEGGFVMVGSSTSNSFGLNQGGKDLYVVRADEIGNILWQFIFGGAGNDIGSSVIIDENQNVIVCGERTQTTGVQANLRDVYVLKLSASGSLIGEYSFGDSTRDEYGTDIFDIPDAGFLITATWANPDSSTYYVIETDENLNVLSKRSRYITPTAGGNNLSSSAFQRTDISATEPLFLAAGTGQELIDQLVVNKFQASYFNTVQDDTPPVLFGDDANDSFCTDAQVTSDRGYVLCGYAENGGAINEMVVKLNNGRFLESDWMMTYANEFNRNVKVPEEEQRSGTSYRAPSIFQTSDDGYIIVSTLELDDPLNDQISLLKINFRGEQEWRQTFGGNDNDIGAEVIELEDGSFVVVGTVGFDINPDSESKLCLIKLNANGELLPME